jgi:hypothetical protein
MRPTKRTTALHFNDLTPPGTTESHRKDGKTQLLDHSRTTSKVLGSLEFELDKFLVDDTFVVTSVKSLLCLTNSPRLRATCLISRAKAFIHKPDFQSEFERVLASRSSQVFEPNIAGIDLGGMD